MIVVAARTRSTRALAWPALALPGDGPAHPARARSINPAGLGLAGLAAIGWAAYILLIRRIGDRFAGTTGLSLTVPIAAATAALPGIAQAAGHLTAGVLAAAAGLAPLLPVLPYAFEMLALRRMRPAAFGTLMALEPAIGVLLACSCCTSSPRPTSSPASCSSFSPAPPSAAADAARPRPNTPTPAANSTSSASPGSTVAIAAALTDRFHARPESSAGSRHDPATPEI
jgi:inner membrane transporter RhtA